MLLALLHEVRHFISPPQLLEDIDVYARILSREELQHFWVTLLRLKCPTKLTKIDNLEASHGFEYKIRMSLFQKTYDPLFYQETLQAVSIVNVSSGLVTHDL